MLSCGSASAGMTVVTLTGIARARLDHRGQVLHLNIFPIFGAMQHLTPRHKAATPQGD